MPNLTEAKAAEYLAPLNAALAEFAINTPERVTAFLAQIGHESGDLRFWREIWGPTPAQKRYDPPSNLAERLGNTRPGDGFKYRGRGPIQITGFRNYASYGQMLGLDLVARPELLEEPLYGFRATGLFWKSNSLNEFADRDSEDAFRQITRRINGGFNGWVDRLKRWHQARKIFGLE